MVMVMIRGGIGVWGWVEVVVYGLGLGTRQGRNHG